MKLNYQTVYVVWESIWKRRGFMSCFGDCNEVYIDASQLYETLAHGKPGTYILMGA